MTSTLACRRRLRDVIGGGRPTTDSYDVATVASSPPTRSSPQRNVCRSTEVCLEHRCVDELWPADGRTDAVGGAGQKGRGPGWGAEPSPALRVRRHAVPGPSPPRGSSVAAGGVAVALSPHRTGGGARSPVGSGPRGRPPGPPRRCVVAHRGRPDQLRGRAHPGVRPARSPGSTRPGAGHPADQRFDPADIADSRLPRTNNAVAATRAALWARSDRKAALILTMTVQQRLASADQLGRAMLRVRRDRRRALIHAVIHDLLGGVQSLGEWIWPASADGGACRSLRVRS